MGTDDGKVAVVFGEGLGTGGTGRMHLSRHGVFFEFTRPVKGWTSLAHVRLLAEKFGKDVGRTVMEAGRESGAPVPSVKAVTPPADTVEVGVLGGKVTMLARGSYALHPRVEPPGKDADDRMAERLGKLGWQVVRG